MLVPNITHTAVLAASTALAPNSSSSTYSTPVWTRLVQPTNLPIPTIHPAQPTNLSVPRHHDDPWYPNPWYDHEPMWDPAPKAKSPLSGALSVMPLQFVRDELPCYIGEGPLAMCLRQAVQSSGRERFDKIANEGSLTDFLLESIHDGLLGVDSNQDWNRVDGLVEYVRRLALDDNPALNKTTYDPETCLELVKVHAGDRLLDEIILSWAAKHHMKDSNNTHPPVERRHVALGVDAPYGNDTAPDEVPGDAVDPEERVVVELDENDFPSAITVPEMNASLHFTWGVLRNFVWGNFTAPEHPIVITQVLQGALPPNQVTPGETALAGRSTRPFNSTRHVNSTRVGSPFMGFVPISANGSTPYRPWTHWKSFNYTQPLNVSHGWRWIPYPVHVKGGNSSLPGFWNGPPNSTVDVEVTLAEFAPLKLLEDMLDIFNKTRHSHRFRGNQTVLHGNSTNLIDRRGDRELDVQIDNPVKGIGGFINKIIEIIVGLIRQARERKKAKALANPAPHERRVVRGGLGSSEGTPDAGDEVAGGDVPAGAEDPDWVGDALCRNADDTPCDDTPIPQWVWDGDWM